MENDIRLILLIIGMMIILIILWDGLRRQKQQKNFLSNNVSSMNNEKIDLFAMEPVMMQEIEVEEPALPTATAEPQAWEDALTAPLDIENEVEEIIALTDEQKQPEMSEPVVTSKAAQPKSDEIIMFSLIASEETLFSGFKLLHVLLQQGFKFGEMNIFHFYEDDDNQATKLFSLAAATQSGQFDLATMANFSCKGLVIFMNAAEHDDPAEVFDFMVDESEKLADELEAELKIGRDEAWTEENLAKIYESLI